ncbi:LacI family DNA-binding transcriptional regulator [Metabacillus arenae]|uniref:LacI family DNA-binding transcriptional regulator n=1 Tax=Metabacillus arenae TaxID=2771434 RepID=A0A926NSW4_9BACI|nr:LacI family DNA-binding transcriptional regulator [Metabacillus arenae]MBD1383337.1 LacI family DNA-binding transcriptional regulator [Metabacillus arenae]
MNKKVTIKEVAKQANVSTATVSNVINNTKFVSEEVRTRVLHVIEELNFHANTLAKGLRIQESRLIGVIVSDIANPFFSKVVSGIEKGAAEMGYNILLCNTASNLDKEIEFLNILKGKRVEGLIISSSGTTKEYFESLENLNIPIVFLNRSPNTPSHKVVITNNIKGANKATEHLIQHGYTRIGIISGPTSLSTGKDRLTGYKRAMEDYHLSIPDSYIQEGDFSIESGYRAMKDLLTLNKDLEACLISNNFMTLGAHKYIKEAGYSIPNDIAVIGYDDSDWADVMDPPLTTVKQPTFEQGQKAIEMLFSTIRNENHHKQQIMYLQPSLVIRKSCGC